MSTPAAVIIPAVEDTRHDAEEINELANRLELSDERAQAQRQEILERLDTCLERLNSLEVKATAENPRLTELSTLLTEIKAEVTTLQSSISVLEANTSSQQPPVLIEEQPPTEPVSTEEPARDAQHAEGEPPVIQRRRVNRL